MTDAESDAVARRERNSSTTHSLTADEVFELLSNRHRRRLLVGLLDANALADDYVDPLDILTGRSESGLESEVELAFVHNHLPKLDAMGVIEWNREVEAVRKGANWDDIASLLQLVRNHQHDLPFGLP